MKKQEAAQRAGKEEADLIFMQQIMLHELRECTKLPVTSPGKLETPVLRIQEKKTNSSWGWSDKGSQKRGPQRRNKKVVRSVFLNTVQD